MGALTCDDSGIFRRVLDVVGASGDQRIRCSMVWGAELVEDLGVEQAADLVEGEVDQLVGWWCAVVFGDCDYSEKRPWRAWTARCTGARRSRSGPGVRPGRLGPLAAWKIRWFTCGRRRGPVRPAGPAGSGQRAELAPPPPSIYPMNRGQRRARCCLHNHR